MGSLPSVTSLHRRHLAKHRTSETAGFDGTAISVYNNIYTDTKRNNVQMSKHDFSALNLRSHNRQTYNLFAQRGFPWVMRLPPPRHYSNVRR